MQEILATKIRRAVLRLRAALESAAAMASPVFSSVHRTKLSGLSLNLVQASRSAWMVPV